MATSLDDGLWKHHGAVHSLASQSLFAAFCKVLVELN